VLGSLDELHRALGNSVVAALAAVLIVLALAVTVAIVAWHGRFQDRPGLRRLARAAEHGAVFCYSLPGTVLALCLIIAARRVAFLGLADTLAILILAYALKTATLGVQSVRPAALMIDRSLIESAQLAGAGWAQRARRIWLPLLRPALWAAAVLVLLPCLSELTMSVLLYGPGTETLGVVLFNLQEYADRSSAAVVGSLLLVAVAIVQIAAGRLDRAR